MHDTVGIMRGCSSKVKTIQQLLYFIILTFLGNEASAQSRPDIVPQNISVSPASVAAGGGTTVFFTVRNQGSASAGPTTTRLRLSTSASGPSLSDPVLADVNTPSIAAGSSVSQNAAATIPAGTANGTYHIWVILDNFSAIQQSNTSNDFGSTTISVSTAPQLPDLVPQNISVSPASVAAGGGTTVFFTVRNQGSGSAGSTTTRLRLSTSSSGPSLSDPVLADVSTPSIAAGSSVSQNAAVTIPAGTSNGTYFIWVILDNFSAIQQSNNNNDFDSTTIVVSTTGITPPAAPTHLLATPLSATNIRLAWLDNSTDEAGFLIERRPGPSGPFNQIASLPPETVSYDDGGLQSSSQYCYRVRATSSAGQSAYSKESCALTSGNLPQPPGAFTLSADPYCNRGAAEPVPAVLLTWTVAVGAESYLVYRDGVSVSNLLPSSATSFSSTNLEQGKTFHYFVRATNSAGTNDSPTVSIQISTDVCANNPGNGAILGAIKDDAGTPISGAAITLSGAMTRQAITDSSGEFSFTALPGGSYRLSPTYANFSFTPRQTIVDLLPNGTQFQTFVAQRSIPTPLITISGPSAGIVGQILTFSAAVSECSADPNGWHWTTSDGQSYQGAAQVGFSWGTASVNTVAVGNSSCPSATATKSVSITTPRVAVELEAFDPTSEKTGALTGSFGPGPDDQALATTRLARIFGAAADNSTLVLLRATTTGPGQVIFSMPGASIPKDGGLSTVHSTGDYLRAPQVVVSASQHGSAYYAFAVYRVPVDYNATSDPSGERTIQFVAEYTPVAGGFERSKPLQFTIKRPPVLFIHGIWSNASTWDENVWGSLLNQDVSAQFFGFAMDYSSYGGDSAKSFSDNSSVVPKALDTILESYRHGCAQNQCSSPFERIFAVNSADVVAHSMGGILVRLATETPRYIMGSLVRRRVHKLVTLDTPHKGTLLAQKLLDITKACPFIATKFKENNRDIDGAVSDLVSPNLPEYPTPSHVLLGIAGNDASARKDCFGDFEDQINKLLKWSRLWFCIGKGIPDSFGSLLASAFGAADNDAIVGKDSQAGGLSDGGTSTSFSGKDGIHTCNTQSEEYKKEVLRLLDISSTDPVNFSPFPSTQQKGAIQRVNHLQSRPVTRKASGVLHLARPSPGQKIASGAVVQVELDPAQQISQGSFLVVGHHAISGQEGDARSVDVQIPIDAIGDYELKASAISSSGESLESPSLRLQVVPAADLQSLTVNPGQVELSGLGSDIGLRVVGHYTDGINREIRDVSTGTTIVPSLEGVVRVKSNGRIEAVGFGSTTLSVRNGDVTVLVPVIVQPGCQSDPSTLCLNSGRFRVQAVWETLNAAAGTGSGTAVPLTGDTGYFWFFDPTNVEVVIKILDGRTLNGSFWVFYGALSDVNYTITVTDTLTGVVKIYYNKAGHFASVADTSAFKYAQGLAGQNASELFASLPASGPNPISGASGSCAADPWSLCLGGRFKTQVTWKSAAGGGSGQGTAVQITEDTGYFWFFGPANVELIVKVLDGRTVNSHFWVFYGALSDVEYTMTVTDTVTGQVKTYHNSQGNLASVADTAAF